MLRHEQRDQRLLVPVDILPIVIERSVLFYYSRFPALHIYRLAAIISRFTGGFSSSSSFSSGLAAPNCFGCGAYSMP